MRIFCLFVTINPGKWSCTLLGFDVLRILEDTNMINKENKVLYSYFRGRNILVSIITRPLTRRPNNRGSIPCTCQTNDPYLSCFLHSLLFIEYPLEYTLKQITHWKLLFIEYPLKYTLKQITHWKLLFIEYPLEYTLKQITHWKLLFIEYPLEYTLKQITHWKSNIYFMYLKLQHLKFYFLPTPHLWILYESQNERPLFPCTDFNDWFL
jgi:hypothetical protein